MAFINATTLVTLKALAQAGAQYIKHSHRNKKLRPNAFIAYAIWNIPAVLTCPNRTAHCEGSCYARKAERAYPTCLPSRMRNLEITHSSTFVRDMVYTILRRRYYCRSKWLVVRIHESGDFYSQAYADAWLEIMRTIASTGERIRFLAYTKSFSFFDGVELPERFGFRASVWDDTPEADLEIIKRNGWPVYTAVDKFTAHDTFSHCSCENCSTCMQCGNMRNKVIACEIH